LSRRPRRPGDCALRHRVDGPAGHPRPDPPVRGWCTDRPRRRSYR
jgi:hypothetical protein